MSVRPIKKSAPPPSSRISNPQTLGPFSGVAQDGPGRKQRPSALSEELVTRGCKFIENGIWDEAEREFRKALKMSSDYPEAYSNLGLCLLYDGRPAEALEALQEAVRQYPGWSTAEGNLALAMQRLERHEEAAHYYRLSLSHNSKQPQAWLSLGDVLSSAAKFDDALEAFQKAAELLPDYALAHQRIGLLHARRGKLNEAEGALNRAVRLDTGLAESHAVLGAIAARRGNIALAKDCFNKIVSEPAPTTAVRGRKRIELLETAAADAMNDWKAAQPETPPLAGCFFQLGLALMRAGNDSEARTAFQKAAALDSEGVPQKLFLAFYAEMNGDALEAKAALERAEQLDPQNGVIPEQLGYIALGMGMAKEADVQFKKAQALGRVLPAELTQSEG